MPVIQCTSCAKRYKVRDEVVGNAVKCKHCGTKFAARDVTAKPTDAGGSGDIFAMAGLDQQNAGNEPPPSIFASAPSAFAAQPASPTTGWDEPAPPPPPMYQSSPAKKRRSWGSEDGLSGTNITLRLIVVGIGFAMIWFFGYMGWSLIGSSSLIPNNNQATKATGIPVPMDLATLVTQGPGNNRYVELSNWAPMPDGLIFMASQSKFSTGPGTVDWTYQAVTIPGQSTPVAVLRSTVWKSERSIESALSSSTISGYVVGRGALGTKEINQLSHNEVHTITKHKDDLWIIDVGREIPAMGTMEPSSAHARFASLVKAPTPADTSPAIAQDEPREQGEPIAQREPIAQDGLDEQSEPDAKIEPGEPDDRLARTLDMVAEAKHRKWNGNVPRPKPNYNLATSIAGTPLIGSRPMSTPPEVSEQQAAALEPGRFAVGSNFYIDVAEGFRVKVPTPTPDSPTIYVFPDEKASLWHDPSSTMIITIDPYVDRTKKFPPLFGTPGHLAVVTEGTFTSAKLIVRHIDDVSETRINGLPFLYGDSVRDYSPDGTELYKDLTARTFAGYDGDNRVIIDISAKDPNDPNLPKLMAMARSFRRAAPAEINAFRKVQQREAVEQIFAKQKEIVEGVAAGVARYHIDVPAMYEVHVVDKLQSNDGIFLHWYRSGQSPDEEPEIKMQVMVGDERTASFQRAPRVITDSSTPIPSRGRGLTAYGAKVRDVTIGGKRGAAIEFGREPGSSHNAAAFAIEEHGLLIVVETRWKTNNAPQRRAMHAVLNSFRESSLGEAAAIKPKVDELVNQFLAESRTLMMQQIE